MMSKKMKRAALDSATYAVHEDPKARHKHQALFQDYQELQKEVESMRDKLDAVKKKKLTLLAEVRFLRRRYKFLLENKASNVRRVREAVQPQNSEAQRRKSSDDWVGCRKEVAFENNTPVFNLKPQRRSHTGKESAPRNATPVFDLDRKEMGQSTKEAMFHQLSSLLDLNQKGKFYKGKEVAVPVIDLNQKERIYGGTEALLWHSTPLLDLNQDGSLVRKEAASQSRAPIFDLNQISREEEEFQNSYESLRMEDPRKVLISGGGDEHPNEMKLSTCRNVGDGPNCSRKRKISWQDPVALRV